MEDAPGCAALADRSDAMRARCPDWDAQMIVTKDGLENDDLGGSKTPTPGG